MESRPTGRWMEAKILKLRRSERKKFSVPHFWSGRILGKSVLTEESEKNLKICLYVEGSPSFIELWWQGSGVCRVCVLFAEVPFSLPFALVFRLLEHKTKCLLVERQKSARQIRRICYRRPARPHVDRTARPWRATYYAWLSRLIGRVCPSSRSSNRWPN